MDLARGVAILGMMAAHLISTPELRALDPSTWGALVHGRSSILFALLAGVSIALMSRRSGVTDPARVRALRSGLVARGAVIFIIGLLLELLGTPIAVILTLYGVLYIAAVPFVRWGVRRLLIAAAALAVAGPPLLALLQSVSTGSAAGLDLVLFGTYPITVWLALALAGMAIGRMRLDRVRTAVSLLIAGAVLAAVGYGAGALAQPESVLGESSADEAATAGSDSADDVGSEISFAEFAVDPADIDFSGLYCEDYGDGYISCYPEEDAVSDEAASTEFEGEESGTGIGSGWPDYVQLVGENDPGRSMVDALVAVHPHSGGTAEVIGSGGFAVVVLALCLLVTRPLRVVLLPLAALGSMPLTAYSLHVLSYALVAGPGGILDHPGVWTGSAVALLLLTTLWSMLRGRGPLENVVARASKAASAQPVITTP